MEAQDEKEVVFSLSLSLGLLQELGEKKQRIKLLMKEGIFFSLILGLSIMSRFRSTLKNHTNTTEPWVNRGTKTYLLKSQQFLSRYSNLVGKPWRLGDYRLLKIQLDDFGTL